MSEEASEETGAENDVSEETKKSDRITAKDLKFSLSIGNEEQEASEKLRYTNFPASILKRVISYLIKNRFLLLRFLFLLPVQARTKM